MGHRVWFVGRLWDGEIYAGGSSWCCRRGEGQGMGIDFTPEMLGVAQ